ncbi:MAG: response regulator [Chthoniobacterales bacterium]
MKPVSNLHEETAPEAFSPSTSGAEFSEHRAFCADLNHKLRTPLNAIIGYAELLALQPANKQSDNDIHQILTSARDLLGIIERELAEPGDRAPQKASAGETAVAPRCDVLYVEDDMVNFTLVERILEYRPGLKLIHAAQGAAGVELAETCQPKMVLLDLNLPDMHGSDVLRRLQENPATATIPVVVLSANATASQIERLLTAGARNYLTKPFDIDPFLAVVDEFVTV